METLGRSPLPELGEARRHWRSANHPHAADRLKRSCWLNEIPTGGIVDDMHPFARIVLPVAVGLALAGCQAAAPTNTNSAPSPSTGSAAAANAADVMFVQMMIPHHQQAVTMCDLILAKQGIWPDVTALATQIKAAQQPEIDQMRGWLKAWGFPEAEQHSGHTGMKGMLSPKQLDAIKTASSNEAERLFLTGMIGHHEGAVTMAKTVEASGAHPEVKKLAATIVSSQQAEIGQMKRMFQR